MTTATMERQQSGNPLISVDDVTFGYGEVPVLESVSIDVARLLSRTGRAERKRQEHAA